MLLLLLNNNEMKCFEGSEWTLYLARLKSINRKILEKRIENIVYIDGAIFLFPQKVGIKGIENF